MPPFSRFTCQFSVEPLLLFEQLAAAAI